MIRLARFPRANRALSLISIVCLLTIITTTVFVSARDANNEKPARPPVESVQPAAAPVKAKVAERFGRLPLSFEENKGQIDGAVKFSSRGSGYELFLTSTEAVLLLRKPRPVEQDQRKSVNEAEVREGSVLRLKMIGANTAARVEGQDELPGKVNYFTGNDPEKWRRNVPTYRKVYYKDLYPGIDVVYYGNQRELEYDFVVAPGANPKVIKFRVDGADRIRLDESGSLLLALKEGEVRLNKPFIYQHAGDGSRREIKGSYVVSGKEISFKLRGFDSDKPLVIDPVLSYSTFLGSNGHDTALGIAVDSQGSAYVTGFTDSTTFPTTAGAFRTTVNFGSAFVTKLDPTGSSLVYSTYISGGGATQGFGIAVDGAGNAHVTGVTSAADFPVVNPLKAAGNFFKTTDSATSWNNTNTGISGDVRSIAVAPNALQIVYAGATTGPHRSNDGGATWSKLPATGLPVFQFPISLAVSPVNSAVVYAGTNNGGLFRSTDSGSTWTTVSLPVPGLVAFTIVFDPVTPSTMYVGTGNGVFKSADGGSTWTSLNNFGLGFPPNVHAIAIDPTTPSTIYTGTFGNGLFKTTNGGTNWSPINNGLTGNENNFVNALAIDPFNPATVYSAHGSSGGPGIINKTTNGGGLWTPINNGVPPDAVVTAIVADRTTPSTIYASTAGRGVVKTVNGGTNWTSANVGFWNAHVNTLVAHAANSAIMFAGTSGAGPNSQDAFVTKLNPSGSGILFSTYLGGSFGDIGNGIAVDPSGNIYVVGETTSVNFPAVNAIQSTPSATENCSTGFVTKINPAVPAYAFSTYLGGSSCDIAHAVALDSAANVYVTGKTHSTDFPVANAYQPTIAETFSGDAFVTKLTTSGSLAYSTFLGGNNIDIGRAIAVDASGQAYIAGTTSSSNFPTLNPIQGFSGGFFAEDAFVTKLNSTGSGLVYSTYLGGEDSDFARGIAVDATGSAYVVGFTNSRNFPIVPGALRTRSAMFKSVNGGGTWTNDNYGLNFGVNSEVTSLDVHPTQPSTIYAATLSGVFKSTNGGRTWSAINNGLDDVRVFELLIDPSTPSTLYVFTSNFGSANSGVYKSIDGGTTWNLRKNGVTSNNVISLAIDPVTPNTLYAAANDDGGSSGKLFKTTDGGDNWVQIGNPPPRSFASIAVDPHNHTTIYGAEPSISGGIFKSVDAGATWNPIGFNQTGAFGTFVAVSPHTPGLVYARLNGLFKSVDGGDNWSKISDTGGKVFFDPVSPSTIYSVSILGGILKSTDNGATFVPIHQGLNGSVEEVLAIHPLNPSTLYAATNPLGGDDAFVAKLNPNGQSLKYSTFLGGVIIAGEFFSTNAQGLAIALDNDGNAYVTGLAQSANFPTTATSFQPLLRAFTDTFISKLTMSYIISGHVLDGSNAPVSGVEVVLNDGTSLTQVVTEGDGSYEFSHLREGGTYTVSASKPHFSMTPPSQTFNNLNSDQTLNFTATATNTAFHPISGQVTINGVGLAGVTLTLSGSQSGLKTTDSNGNYSFELVAGGNYTVTPSILGFTFGPVNQTFNNLSAPQVANFTATRQNFVVTNTNNHGAGSLREAINNANATVGTDTILFNIPGSGIKTLNLMNALPDITDPVVIDGTSQPGYAGSPLVEINGQAISSERGLFIKASGTTVRGLAIGNFSSGAGIFVQSCNNHVFQGNYLGVDATGTTARPNSTGLLLAHSSNNLVGGTTAAARNVISGNSFNGINMVGGNNVIQGNYIGTNASGTAAIGNGNSGVNLTDLTFTNNLIGGTTPGAGNLISGNSAGIVTNTPGATIQGNLVGTDVTGTKKIPNNGPGVWTGGTNTLIGGLTPAARNVISGNAGNGVFASGVGNKVQGNFVGTDITGTLPLGNSATGVVAGNGTLVGGTTPEARNIISANGSFGNVALGENSSGPAAIVQGNYIGTDVTGTKALSPSNTMWGIGIFSDNHVIGGTAAGAGNVISGNGTGIQVGGGSSAQGNIIQGNLIGLNAQGTAPLPNSQTGVQFSADNNTLGGTQSGAANKIAFNGVNGVSVSSGTGNSIRGNSIFSNALLGLHLRFITGTSANDPGDPDIGPNNQQNFPIITTVSSNAGSTTIQGSLNSTPNTSFHIDFYSNASVDPIGRGEGALFLGTTLITTNGNGDATINVTLPAALPPGRVITATATDPNGNTSEFSAADPNAATGTAQFNFTSFFVIEDVGLATVTVQRTGGSFGDLTVEYETINGTATAGQDYTATSGTLSFANGETSKTIQVPILDDLTTEPDETFTLSLKNAANLESISAPASMVITIQDRTTVPALLSFNASVIEGNAGTTTDARFEVRLSAATGRTISVNYATANFNAHGGAACGTQGVDYESTSGTITFQPGMFSIFVPVKVCGDTSAEANETFSLNLSGASNATIANGQGVGVILNDDVIELLLEEMGPGVSQAAALDALLALRDPFRIVTVPELFANGTDRNTRVVLFVRNLQLNPGEASGSVSVRLVASNNQVFDVFAEDFRAVPNTDLMQVVFKLPSGLPAGTCTVIVRSHTRASNMGTIRIAP
jgi:hypothetical protein